MGSPTNTSPGGATELEGLERKQALGKERTLGRQGVAATAVPATAKRGQAGTVTTEGRPTIQKGD